MVAFDRVGSPAALEAAVEAALDDPAPSAERVIAADGIPFFARTWGDPVLTGNGDWDGGLASLADPAAAGARFRLVRGDPATGGLVPDAAAASFADRIGSEHVITIPRGAHSPMRDRPAVTLAALLRALQP